MNSKKTIVVIQNVQTLLDGYFTHQVSNLQPLVEGEESLYSVPKKYCDAVRIAMQSEINPMHTWLYNEVSILASVFQV